MRCSAPTACRLALGREGRSTPEGSWRQGRPGRCRPCVQPARLPVMMVLGPVRPGLCLLLCGMSCCLSDGPCKQVPFFLPNVPPTAHCALWLGCLILCKRMGGALLVGKSRWVRAAAAAGGAFWVIFHKDTNLYAHCPSPLHIHAYMHAHALAAGSPWVDGCRVILICQLYIRAVPA